jgi:hypothetical protein
MGHPAAGREPRLDTMPAPLPPDEIGPCACCGIHLERQNAVAVMPGARLARLAHLACARSWRMLTLEYDACG